jgi:hypothetical protein
MNVVLVSDDPEPIPAGMSSLMMAFSRFGQQYDMTTPTISSTADPRLEPERFLSDVLGDLPPDPEIADAVSELRLAFAGRINHEQFMILILTALGSLGTNIARLTDRYILLLGTMRSLIMSEGGDAVAAAAAALPAAWPRIAAELILSATRIIRSNFSATPSRVVVVTLPDAEPTAAEAPAHTLPAAETPGSWPYAFAESDLPPLVDASSCESSDGEDSDM